MADEDSKLQLKVTADASGLTAGIDASVASVSKGTAQIGSEFEKLEKNVERSQHSMREARESFELLGDSIGVKIPFALRTFLAAIGPVGAVVETAFAPLAALAIVEVISKLNDKLEESRGKAAELKEAYSDAQVVFESSTQSLDRSLDSIDVKLETIAHGKVAGLEIEFKNLGTSALEVKKDIDELFTSIQKVDKESNHGLGLVDGFSKAAESYAEFINPVSADVAKVPEQFKEIKASIDAAFASDAANKTHTALNLINQDLSEQVPRLAQVKEEASHLLAAGDFVKQQQSIIDFLVAAQQEAAKGAQIDAGVQQSKQLDIAAAKAEQYAKDEKQSLQVKLDGIATWKAQQQLAYEQGSIDVAQWSIAQRAATDAVNTANVQYFSNLEQSYRKAGDLEKAEDAAKQGAAEKAKVLAKDTSDLAKSMEEYSKATAKIREEHVSQEFAESARATQQYLTDVKSLAEAEKELSKAQGDLEQAKGGAGFEAQIEKTRQLAATKQISEEQAAAQLKSIYQQEEDAAIKNIDKQIAAQERIAQAAKELSEELARYYGTNSPQFISAQLAYDKDLAAYKQLETKKLDEAKQFSAKIAAEDNKMTAGLIASLSKMQSQFNSTFASILTGTETITQGVDRLFIGMANTVVQNLLKIGEQELVGMLLHKSMAEEQGLTDAKLAAKNTYAAVSAIPVIGPFLAPEAAAAAFAAVLAFEEGGLVPRTGMAFLHENERVATPDMWSEIKSLKEGSGSGGNFHYHAPTVNALDRDGVEDVLNQHRNHVTKMVKTAFKRGSLNPRSFLR